MDSKAGWIKLYRSSFENELYFKQTFTDWQAWVDLLLLANHKTGVFEKRGHRVVVPRGCVGYSARELGKRWGWSKNKVLRFLSFLDSKSEPQIRTQKNGVTTLITILNYDKYQHDRDSNWDSKRDTDGPQTAQNKNVKEYSIVRNKGKKFEKNETESNRNVHPGEALFAERYGSAFPALDFGAKKNLGSEDGRADNLGT